MPEHELRQPDFDWRVTSFEGARREQLRRWARLPLESIVLAIEEMEEMAQQLGATPGADTGHLPGGRTCKNPPG